MNPTNFQSDNNPYPVEPTVRIDLGDVYRELLQIKERLIVLEQTAHPISNGNSRLQALESHASDIETRLRLVETAVISNTSKDKEISESRAAIRANVAIGLSILGFVASITSEFLAILL